MSAPPRRASYRTGLLAASAVMVVLLLLAAAAAVMTPPGGAAYAQQQQLDPDSAVLYARETVSAALDIIAQRAGDGSVDGGTVMLAKLGAEVFSANLQAFRGYDEDAAEDMHIGLLDLHDRMDSGIWHERSAREAQRLGHLIGAYSPENPDVGASIAAVLTVVDLQYQQAVAAEEGGDGGDASYELARRLAVRAQEMLADAVRDGRDNPSDVEVASFLAMLVRGIDDRDDPRPVGSLVGAAHRDLTGFVPAGYGGDVTYDMIRHLYLQMDKELDGGDYGAARELAVEAYLDHFEYLEADIEKADPDLLHKLELDMREELIGMIDNGQDAQRIRVFASESILPDLGMAQEAVRAQRDGDPKAPPVYERRLLDRGDATDDQKSGVRNEIDVIREKLRMVLVWYAAGNGESAYTHARSAYLDSYEHVEIPLRAIDPDFTLEVEFQFADLRNLIRDGAAYEDVQDVVVSIRHNLDESERIVTGTGTLAPAIAFTSSFAVIFREGLESVLILGAIITYLEASRNHRFKKYIHYGILGAFGATAATWVAASYIIEISGVNRELIEAVAALSATAVLFYVSFWVLNKIEHKKWMEFVKAKVWQATTTGSVMVFFMLAFFTVYREGFETVLFYQAMFGLAQHMELQVGLGFVTGIGSLLVLYVVMRKLGKRLPLRALFGLTMGVGAYLSIAFLGNGIRELQVLEALPTTSLIGTVPRLDINLATMTGIYPTLETLVGQFVLLGVYLTASTYVLFLRPRRARRLAEMRVSHGGGGET